MKYKLFEIGPFTVYSYGLMIAIGIVAAFVVAQKRAKRYGLDEDQVFNMGVWCAIGGLLGAKLMYLIVDLPNILENPKLLLNVANGFVVYGGIILGIITGWLYCRIKKRPFLKFFDLIMPSIALAQGFGRIGCFLAGCCYGAETECGLHVTFSDSPFAPNGVPLIPTQLLSSAGDFLIFLILVMMARRIHKDGVLAGWYLILYSVGRFVIEFFRGDPRGSVGFLSTSQFLALFLLAAGVILVVYMSRRKLDRQR